jgi:hypothetical protein
MLHRLFAEPPFRLIAREVIRRFGRKSATRALWDASERPPYLVGLVHAAQQARVQGVSHLCAVEFGVAGGRGLRILEREAAAVERDTGVTVTVVGFDAGSGLPAATSGDYRDHPDYWQPGDFPMDVEKLRASVGPRTQLVVGDIRETLPRWIVHTQPAPVGFVSFDLDYYSSTLAAFEIFVHPAKRMLHRVACYFDDIIAFVAHRDAGELLAIRTFNAQHQGAITIDRWHGIRQGRPFDHPYLEQMFVAHDLEAISQTVLTRSARELTLDRH